MTIDESITKYKEKAEYFKSTTNVAYSLELKQIAEWLEELKEYRKHIKLTEIPKQYKLGFQDGIVNGFENGYNKAIADFYNALANDLIWIKERFGDDVYTDLWCDVGTRAVQLKAGGNNA